MIRQKSMTEKMHFKHLGLLMKKSPVHPQASEHRAVCGSDVIFVVTSDQITHYEIY